MPHDNLRRLADFSGRKAFGYLKDLAVTIGPRWTGSPAEHRAARYIEKQFKGFGLETRLQKFPVRTFANKQFKFEVHTGEGWRELNAQPVCMTADARSLEGELYLLESTERHAFSEEMRGKILMSTAYLLPATRYELIKRYEPKAWVTIEGGVNVEALRYALPYEDREEFGALPMVRMAHLEAVELVRQGHKRVRLTMVNEDADSYGLNVIGEVKGTERPDEIIAVTAHYDTSFGISGASDNAGGTAIMMELARVIAKAKPKRTFRFIGFAAEETKLQGSKYYSWDLEQKDKKQKALKRFNEKFHRTELEKHVFCFNIDVQGAILGHHSFSYLGPDDIAGAVRLLNSELGIPGNIHAGPAPMDGTALAAVGIPALQFARSGGTGGFMHTSYDDIRYLSADALAQAGGYVELYLKRHFAEAFALPFERAIPEDQAKGLSGYKRVEPKAKTKKATKKTVKKSAKRAPRKTTR
jgi:aminopeptidase YwaD